MPPHDSAESRPLTTTASFDLRTIGWIQSELRDPHTAPRQADENAPMAWLVFDSQVEAALADVCPGDRLVLVTWLHLARRDVLQVHPRNDPARPRNGVFSTRAAERPNPIGIHDVEVVRRDGLRVLVRGLDAIDGTPIMDLKARLDPEPKQR
jgi:tRNA-Thr(GGU) m(6)t(6)A37 methyltransferase TsaA